MKIHVGTSGFSYGHWWEVFYPESLPPREWLEFYARHAWKSTLRVSRRR